MNFQTKTYHMTQIAALHFVSLKMEKKKKGGKKNVSYTSWN